MRYILVIIALLIGGCGTDTPTARTYETLTTNITTLKRDGKVVGRFERPTNYTIDPANKEFIIETENRLVVNYKISITDSIQGGVRYICHTSFDLPWSDNNLSQLEVVRTKDLIILKTGYNVSENIIVKE